VQKTGKIPLLIFIFKVRGAEKKNPQGLMLKNACTSLSIEPREKAGMPMDLGCRVFRLITGNWTSLELSVLIADSSVYILT